MYSVFTGTTRSLTGLTDGQIYYVACRNKSAMWDSVLSSEVSGTPRARMAAFTLSATSPARITKSLNPQNASSVLSGWTSAHFDSIRIRAESPGSNVTQSVSVTPSTSSLLISPIMYTLDSTTAKPIAFIASDIYYPISQFGGLSALCTATISVLGKLDFTYAKAIVTDSGVCKAQYTMNSTSLDNGDINPVLATLSGDSSATNGVLTASSKYVSGATVVDLAELTIPAFGEGIQTAANVSSGAQYLTYDWLAYPPLPTMASQISTASTDCVLANIATSPACWSWQWRSRGMTRKVGSTANACSTCSTENKPYGVTDSLDWKGTITVGASVTAGAGHVCYVTKTDTIKCAGANNDGQLGDGTITAATTPVEVLCGQAITADCVGGKLSRIVKVVALGNTTCALSRGGVPYCWGAQTSGTIYDMSLAIPTATWVPNRFRNSFNFAFTGAVDIGFSAGNPYGVERFGYGTGFNAFDVSESVILNYAAIFATGSESMDNTVSASWLTSATAKIEVSRTAAQSINHVTWTLGSGSGSADDARNAKCQKVTLLTK